MFNQFNRIIKKRILMLQTLIILIERFYQNTNIYLSTIACSLINYQQKHQHISHCRFNIHFSVPHFPKRQSKNNPSSLLTRPYQNIHPLTSYFPFISYNQQNQSDIQMQQQNKASAQPNTSTSLPAVPPPQEWHASQIAAPVPCNSTIKRISGKQVYLKDKPQALILLQAAEIQRLTTYLNDYKCKFRTISKEPLDRQSYEVQIKELFERDANNKIEIERLNKIISNMTLTGEQYQKQVLSAQEKYRLVLAQRDALGERNIYVQRQLQNTRDNFDRYIKKSEAEIYSLNNQLTSHKIYTESVLKNNADLVARVNTIPTYERRIFQMQTQIVFYIEQTQRMNKELEVKTEKLISQERGYSTLYQRHKTLLKSHEDLKTELDSHAKGLQAHKKEAETKSVMLMAKHEEEINQHAQLLTKKQTMIEELTKSLHDTEKALHASKGQLKLSQQIIKTLQTENERLKKQQEELKAVSAERESLTRSIKEKTSTINQLEKSLKQQKQKQAQIATKQSKLQEEYEDLKRRFAEENISLNKMINNKVTESESLKRQLINNEQELRSQIESNFQAQAKAHEQKIAKIHEQKQAVSDAHEGLKAKHNELKTKHGEISQEKEEIAKKYGQLSVEYESLKAKTVQLETSIEEYKLKIIELTKIYDLLKIFFDQASQNNDKLLQQLTAKESELQTSQNILSKQKQELNLLKGTTIRLKSEKSCFQLQIYELKEQITKLKGDNSKLTQQMAQKDSQIAKVKVQRQQLSKMLQGKTKEGEGLKRRMIELQNELRDSFETALKEKEDTHTQAYKLLSQQHEDLSKQKDKLQAQKETVQINSAEYQARIALLLQEIERLHTLINSTIEKSKLELEQARNNGAAQQTQIATLTQKMEESQKRQKELTTKYTVLSKKVTSYEETLQNIRGQLITIQLRTGQLRSERDLLIKKNAMLVKSIRALSAELDTLQKQGDSIAAFFTKESAIHKELTTRFTTLQDLLNSLESEKWTFEEKTVEITQAASQ